MEKGWGVGIYYESIHLNAGQGPRVQLVPNKIEIVSSAYKAKHQNKMYTVEPRFSGLQK